MSTTDSRADKYSKNTDDFPFYNASLIYNYDVLARAFSSSFQFNTNLFNIFVEIYSIYLDTISRLDGSGKDQPELDKTLRTKFGKVFEERFREERFLRNLSDTVASNSELIKITCLGKIYQHLSNKFSVWNNNYVEPIRDILYRTPSQKICELEKYSLFRYDKPALPISERKNVQMQNHDHEEKSESPPVLVIYAFINRHYILDLLPEVSVVRNLLYQGLDIFATDWGTPSVYDRTLTIGHFVNRYIDCSVDLIRRITKSDKVSLLGYCWGVISHLCTLLYILKK